MENSEKSIQLEIFTPYGEYLNEEVTSIDIVSSGSSFGLLPDHYPLISTLKISILYLTIENKRYAYAIGEGVLNIKENNASILVECIERSDQIDIERAKLKAEEVTQKLKDANEESLVNALNKSLKKAENRIEVYNLDK